MTDVPVMFRADDGTVTMHLPDPPAREYPVSTELLKEWVDVVNENVTLKVKLKRRLSRAKLAHWLTPGFRFLAVCPGCELDVTTVGLSDLAYTFEVHSEELCEQLWHRACLIESDDQPIQADHS